MKKKILSSIMAMCLFVSLFSAMTVSATTSGTCGDNLTWTLDNGTLNISGEGDMDDYSHGSLPQWGNITSVVIGDGVTSIGDYAFYYCNNLKSVTIPDSVVSIGDMSFENCSNLTSITIPESVIAIEQWAFSDCDSLTSIKIPDSVTYIGGYAFSDCDKLKDIELPDRDIYISNDAFKDTAYYKNNNNWTDDLLYVGNHLVDCNWKNIDGDYEIKDNTRTIADSTFSNCSGLTKVKMPDSVIMIGNNAFSGCENLKSVKLSENVKEIGYGAFSNCSNLTSIEIPYGIEKIDSWMFSGCSNLVNVRIPYSVKVIDDEAFKACSSLTSLEIPNSVEDIGSEAFSDCSSLTNLEIPNSVESISLRAFKNCSNLKEITISNYYDTIFIYDEAFSDCCSLENVTILGSDKTAFIEEGAFKNCSSLKYITTMGFLQVKKNAFYNCTRLTDVYCPYSKEVWKNSQIFDETEGNEYYTNVTIHYNYSVNDKYTDGYYTYKLLNNKATITSVDKSIAGDITIPSKIGGYDVVYIGERAFAECNKITSIIMPDSIKNIGTYAFSECTSLKSIELSKGLKELQDSVFHTCTSLEEIFIPNGVEIEYYNIMVGALFVNCEKLTSILVSEDNPNYTSVDGILFNKDKTILVGYPTGKTEKSYEVPSTVKEIGDGAFENNKNIETIIIPNGVEKIGFGSLWCDNLKELYLPKSLTCIGGYNYIGENVKCDVYYDGGYLDFQKIERNIYAFLEDVNIYYNISLTPTTAEITKVETEDEYSFEIDAEKKYENCYVYVAVYDENGMLNEINRVPLDTSDSTSVAVGKGNNASKAKIFILADSLQPIISVQQFILN